MNGLRLLPIAGTACLFFQLPTWASPESPRSEQVRPLRKSFRLRAVRLEGSTVFERERVDEIVAPYLGKTVTFETLLQIQSSLTDLYVRAGYVTSGVILPRKENQELQNGVVIYRALEGKVTNIQIEGLTHLNESYVRSRLMPYLSKPLNVYQLERGLQLLQMNPLVAELESRLIPGSQPARHELILTLKEAARWLLALEGSNDENPAVGEWGGKLSVANQNLWKLGHSLKLEYKFTEGLERFLVTNQIPLNAKDGMLNWAYQRTENQIVAEPFDQLGIRNEANIVSLNVTQPLVKNPRNSFSLGFTVEYSNNQSYLFEQLPFSFAPNVKDGYTEMMALRFNQTFLTRSVSTAFLGDSQVSVGFDNLTDDSNFVSWQGQLQWLQKWGEDVQLSVRLATQLTPNVLPSLEECAIGGINGNRFIFGNTVRGYATNVRSGDNCLALSTELQFELLETSNWGTVALISFLDFGTVWDNQGEVFAPNTLVSTGFGLRWLIGDYLSLRADYGIGLVEVEQESLEKQHWNVSLELGTSF